MTTSANMICNQALSHIGARAALEDFTTELTAEAEQCNLWYDFSRKQALAVHNWTFARYRKALALHGVAAPAGLWSFRYQYPSDCIKLVRLIHPAGRQADAIPFEIESVQQAGAFTKSILTDLDNATALYTFDVTDTTIFTPFFVELLAYLIAYHIAYALTGKREIEKDMITIYSNLTTLAPKVDAEEGLDEKVRDADQIRVRGSGYYDRQRFPRTFF